MDVVKTPSRIAATDKNSTPKKEPPEAVRWPAPKCTLPNPFIWQCSALDKTSPLQWSEKWPHWRERKTSPNCTTKAIGTCKTYLKEASPLKFCLFFNCSIDMSHMRRPCKAQARLAPCFCLLSWLVLKTRSTAGPGMWQGVSELSCKTGFLATTGADQPGAQNQVKSSTGNNFPRKHQWLPRNYYQ